MLNAVQDPAPKAQIPLYTRSLSAPDLNVTVRVYPQDPRVSEPVELRVPRDTFESAGIATDGLPAPGAYPPGTPDFAAVAAHVLCARTRSTLEGYLGRPIPWAVPGPLKLRPNHHPGRQSYYDRVEGVSLQYFLVPELNTTARAANSADLVAHETGHAVLDGLKPGFSQGDLETQAFAEAFGDVAALLEALTFPENRAGVLAETGGDLTRPNLLSRFGEEWGHALCFHEDPGRDFLRSGLNDYRYVDPASLPPGFPGQDDRILTSEPHSFSRIFSGAFYDLVAALYQEQFLRGRSGGDALRASGQIAGRLLMRAVDQAPPERAHFQEVAAGMLVADREQNQGQYEGLLRQVFARRGLAS